MGKVERGEVVVLVSGAKVNGRDLATAVANKITYLFSPGRRARTLAT